MRGGADREPRVPFPLSDVSNGEWCPRPPSAKQRLAARLIADQLPYPPAKRLVRERLASDLLRHPFDGDADGADRGLSDPLVDDPFEQSVPRHECYLRRKAAARDT